MLYAYISNNWTHRPPLHLLMNKQYWVANSPFSVGELFETNVCHTLESSTFQTMFTFSDVWILYWYFLSLYYMYIWFKMKLIKKYIGPMKYCSSVLGGLGQESSHHILFILFVCYVIV